MLQRDLHAQLKHSLGFSRDRIAALARPLDPDLLAQRPGGGGWSIGEVLEHLCVVDEQYEERTWGLVASGRPDTSNPEREWRPTKLGQLMAGMLSDPKPMKAPKRYVPGADIRDHVLDQFLSRSATLCVQMDVAVPLDWTALRMEIPRLPFFVKLNLGDVYSLQAVHVSRHLGQMERVLAGIA